MNESQSKNYNTIDLIELAGVMWRNKLVIIACVLVCTVMSFINVQYFKDDTYSAGAILYVSNKDNMTQNDGEILKSDIDTSRTMSITYIEVLKTTSFLMDVSKSLDNRYSWDQIGRMMSIASVNETELLRVNVTALDPNTAYEVANAIMEQAPVKLSAIFKGGEVEVADPPLYPGNPNGKGTARSVAMGFLLGAVIGAAICFAFYYFDNKVHKGDEVAKRYNVSVLGELN